MTAPSLPQAPTTGRSGLPTVPPAGPYWRIWHPTAHVTAADVPRNYGPIHRFDPHPEGPPAVHHGVFVLYGSLAFEVSALEVFHRGRAATPRVVDVCANWRGTLPGVHGVRYFSFRAADRAGVATVVFRRAAIGSPGPQHLLIDDALWPYLVHTLDAVGVAANRVARCPRCAGK